MADVVLFRDTFNGPAGPVDEGRAPDVGAYEYLDGGELGGDGTLTCDALGSVGSATPDPAATYRAATEFLTTGGLGGVELGAGEGAYFWAEVRFVTGVGLVVSPGDHENSFDDVPVSMPVDAVLLSIEVGPSGTDVSYMGDVVATFPTFTSASLSGAGLYTAVYSGGGGGGGDAVVLNYVELIQSAPTDSGGGGSTPVSVALPAHFNSTWEAEQEVARATASTGPVDVLIRVDFTGPAQELPDTDLPAPTHSGVSNAVYYVQGVEAV